jgi:hypothetical protein
MKLKLVPITVLFCTALSLSPLVNAQDVQEELAQALKEAQELSKKTGGKPVDMKEQLAAALKDQAEDEARKKAALKKQLEAPGPVVLPEWTPPVPQFTPAGPATRKLVDDQVEIVLTGTSPLTPAELGDAWEAAKREPFSFGRNNSNVNETRTVTVSFSTMEAPVQKVSMEAKRAPGEKITRVTLSSLLPKPGEG